LIGDAAWRCVDAVARGHQPCVGIEGAFSLARCGRLQRRQVDAGLGGEHAKCTFGGVAKHAPARTLVVGRQQPGVVAQRGGAQQRA
jgi:hypothetical protein